MTSPALRLLGPPTLRAGGRDVAFAPERPYLLLAGAALNDALALLQQAAGR